MLTLSAHSAIFLLLNCQLFTHNLTTGTLPVGSPFVLFPRIPFIYTDQVTVTLSFEKTKNTCMSIYFTIFRMNCWRAFNFCRVKKKISSTNSKKKKKHLSQGVVQKILPNHKHIQCCSKCGARCSFTYIFQRRCLPISTYV